MLEAHPPSCVSIDSYREKFKASNPFSILRPVAVAIASAGHSFILIELRFVWIFMLIKTLWTVFGGIIQKFFGDALRQRRSDKKKKIDDGTKSRKHKMGFPASE